MKTSHKIILSLLIIAVAFYSFTRGVDNKIHDFSTGLVCGLGIGMLFKQLQSFNQRKKKLNNS